MKAYWLTKNNNDNLIVFFAGWSFDYNPFLNYGENYDVLCIYDYNSLELPTELQSIENYKEKNLITWSMGVFVAYKFRTLFKNFNNKIAINGTVTPVDDNFGIPTKIFELTLKHAQKGLQENFYKNIFNSTEEYVKYTQNSVQRTIENRVSELQNLYKYIKEENFEEYEKFYDRAIVSEFDKIIPPANQIASHKTNGTPILQLATGHFPFYNFDNWTEVINAK